MSDVVIEPLIFISHAAESDREMANKFKAWIMREYGLQSENVFVSSSPDSISGDDFYTAKIGLALKRESVMIVLLSPAAIKKRWIVFETGVGFGRDSLLPPILCKGATVEDLSQNDPIGLIQAKRADILAELAYVIDLMDNKLKKHHNENSIVQLQRILGETDEHTKVPFRIEDICRANDSICGDDESFYRRPLML